VRRAEVRYIARISIKKVSGRFEENAELERAP